MVKNKAQTNTLRVFIADDSLPVRERLVGMLEGLPGIEVVGEAGDTPEAIALIKKHKPDVAILDIRMPGRSGIEVLEIVKMSNPDLKVIVLTNYPEPQYKKRCMELGADHFIDKSNDFIKIPELLAALSTKDKKVRGTAAVGNGR